MGTIGKITQLALIVFLVAATGARGDTSKGLECAIRTDMANGLLRLKAVAIAMTATTGRYDLSVIKRSETGSSQNNQSGAFKLAEAGEGVLTTIMLDGSAVGHYHAELNVDSDKGRVSCSSP